MGNDSSPNELAGRGSFGLARATFIEDACRAEQEYGERVAGCHDPDQRRGGRKRGSDRWVAALVERAGKAILRSGTGRRMGSFGGCRGDRHALCGRG